MKLCRLAARRDEKTMAMARRIQGANRVLGKPHDWNPRDICMDLAVRNVILPQGQQFMVSAWELFPEELEALKNGETLKLWISGDVHPVVCITVGELE